MNREDVRKLLGGYATGTLTPAEQQALFEAALEDQELFDTLAREQPLRELLRDPGAKAELLAALDEPKQRWYERFAAWKPAIAAAALAGVAGIAVFVVRPGRHSVPPLEVAQLRPPAPPIQPAAPAPAPAMKAPQSAAAESRRKGSRPAPTARQLAAPEPLGPKRAAKSKDVQLADTPVEVAAAVAPPPAAPAAQPVRTDALSRVKVSAEASPKPAVSDRRPMVGGVVGGVTGGFSAGANQPPGARDLYYAGVSGFLPKEEDASKTEKRAEAKQRNVVTSGPAAFGAGTGLLRPASAPSATNLGVKYTILRKPPAGEFVETTPNNLKAGDTVAVRFEANDDGYLLVQGRRAGELRPIYSGRLERLTPLTIPALDPADQELVVTFSRQPQPAATASLVRTQEAEMERATYVVTDRRSAPVQFTIRLDYR